jgi:hypothetical protein
VRDPEGATRLAVWEPSVTPMWQWLFAVEKRCRGKKPRKGQRLDADARHQRFAVTYW